MPTADDLEFKELALKNNKLKTDQCDECLKTLGTYERAGMPKPLSGIVLEKGYMSLQDINAIYQLQGKQSQYIIQGYTIMETLGQGGLGVVYKARDSVNRIVALKVMFPHLTSNADYLQRFMNEAKICTQLDHPHIVKGLAFGESAGLYFFAMEFVSGRSLKDIIKSAGKFAEKEAIYIVLKVAEALKYAEDRSLIHRDIKPENIMLTTEGVPKLCDLGLAKTMDSDMSLTHTGMVVGTPYYISPEQALSQKDLDIRSDIYSLGITLYYMVTGEVPYQGDSVVSIISQHLSHQIPRPQEKNPLLSNGICDVITKMMAKERDNRYQTAQELIVDLNRFLRDEQPLAGEVPPAPKAVKDAALPTTAKQDKSRANAKETTGVTSSIMSSLEQVHQDKKEITQAETMYMSSAESAAAHKLSKEQEQESEQAAKEETHRLRPAKEAVAEQDRVQSRELIKNLEQKIGKHRPSKRLLTARFIAVMLLLSLLTGGAVVAYLNHELLTLKFEQYFVSVPVTEPLADISYQPGLLSVQSQKEFDEAARNLKPLQPVSDRTKDMAHIAGGSFTMGNKYGEADETIKQVQLGGYYLDKYEVSNHDYAAFVKATGHRAPDDWVQGVPPADRLDFPVVNVSFYDASLYCKWLGKRLPTEAEWEYAVKGSLQYEYPWGRTYDKGCANIGTGQLKIVSAFPKGKTVHGIHNLAGNVWEWTASPYVEGEEDMVIKGGSFAYSPQQARASYRDGFAPYGKRGDLGFRGAFSAENK